MRATKKHLHYSVKGSLEVCEDCDKAKIKHKSIEKVTEERNIDPDKMVYLYLISQKKPILGTSVTWFLF